MKRQKTENETVLKMAPDDVCFDEKLLFTEFEEEQKTKQTEKLNNECARKQSSKFLQEENTRLKKALKALLSIATGTCATQERLAVKEELCPLFQAIYFDNRTSIRNREKVEDFVQSLQSNPENRDERESFGSEKLPPSVLELNYEVGKIRKETGQSCLTCSVINSVQYFEDFCFDRTGFPLVDLNPRITDGWTIPKYEQVFFNVLPCNEATPNVKIRQSRACFNCGNEGHNVQDCPEPQDTARINANRKEFLNKFSSPINSKSPRYHFDESQEKRFGGFKPGVIGEKLKEALGIGKGDLPLYIYRMRAVGYPPGYLPNASKPSLVLYDADGNVDDYVMEEADEGRDNVHRDFIEYPGFNTHLPEGVKDISAELGLPPMSLHQHINNLAALYQHTNGLPSRTAPHQNKRKRKRTELDRVEEDMEVVEDDERSASTKLETAASFCSAGPTKRRRYEDASDGSDGDRMGYSPAHPGVQYGAEEMELLKHYRKHSGSGRNKQFDPPLPETQSLSTTNFHSSGICYEEGSNVSGLSNGKANKKPSRESLEEGEVISDEDEQDEEEEEEDDYPPSTPGWWLREPLDSVSTTAPKLCPPPKPTVLLPLEALSRFYTNSTVLQKMSFEDRVMWLDPIYGNIQPVSGRYEKLKKILGNKPSRK